MNKLSEGMEAKFEHDLSSVGFDRLDRDTQRCGHLFVALTLTQKSNDFDLARGWAALRQLTSLRLASRLEKPFQHNLGYLRGKETFTLRYAFHGFHQASRKIGFQDVPRDLFVEAFVDFERELASLVVR